ncbi:arylamine N-acetyltransferase [Kitasatospora sp. NPDC036755]|uniref:arylamine N-acetyltransferase family protein n=1 Tax=Kitasatospora sp. NPDC036755 TaxID=3154600 RepID=UPI0033C4B52D
MYDIDAYLAHLGHTGPVEPTVETLRSLHKKHLMTVPFDNSVNAERGDYIWDYVEVDIDEAFDGLILGGGGGTCFELSGLFRRLLIDLGYEVDILAAGVRGPDGGFGPDLEHLFTGVRIDGEVWLADVGFAGPSFIEPVRVADEPQEQYGCVYRVVAHEEEPEYHVLRRQAADSEAQAVYRFKLQPRSLADWKRDPAQPEAVNPEWNWAGELVSNTTVIRSRATETGQIMLVGRRCLTVDGGREQFRVLVKAEDYDAVVADVLRRRS